MNLVSRRIAFLAVLFTSTLSAQFSGLSSTGDGSSLYFASTLRLKGSSQPRNGKVFLATQDGVSLFRAREPAFPPADSPACTVGGFADYLGAETSAAGVVALSYLAKGAGICSYPANAFTTQIVTASGDTNLPGNVRLSAGGRYAIVFYQANSRPSSAFTLAFLDLQTGTQTPVPIIGVPFPEYVPMPYTGGRIIANDGTALLGIRVVQLAPKSVSIIVPWDIQSDGGSIRIQAEAPGDHTPFYFPEVIASVSAEQIPRAGPILHQDWTQTFVGPIGTGEIIHVYAIGFGPVSPEVPEGAAAPSAEPFSRITQSLTCSNAEILYAGLAPGAVERVYQIDIRIGPTPGYQKFTCSLGGADPFLFLTLDIVP